MAFLARSSIFSSQDGSRHPWHTRPYGLIVHSTFDRIMTIDRVAERLGESIGWIYDVVNEMAPCRMLTVQSRSRDLANTAVGRQIVSVASEVKTTMSTRAPKVVITDIA